MSTPTQASEPTRIMLTLQRGKGLNSLTAPSVEFLHMLKIFFSILSHNRSSDSAKYTNKSSGASVTSITHSKSSHLSSLKSHPTVSSNRKPPMCPNRHSHTTHNKSTAIPAVHNTNNTASCSTSSSVTATSTLTHSAGTVPPSCNNYHNPNGKHRASSTTNNCLHNNSTFHNNHYTFSLNRQLSRHHANGGVQQFIPSSASTNEYLDSMPYHYQMTSSKSCYGGAGARVHQNSRGTKSDIGVPTSRRRTSIHKFTTPNIQEHPLPVPGDGDMNGNSQLQNRRQSNVNPYYMGSIGNVTSPTAGVDYLENYKTATMDFYTRTRGGGSVANGVGGGKRTSNNNEPPRFGDPNHSGLPVVYGETGPGSLQHESSSTYAVPIDVSTT